MKIQTVIKLRTKRKELDDPMLDMLRGIFDEDELPDSESTPLGGENGEDGNELNIDSVRKMLEAIFGGDEEMDELYSEIDDDEATEIITEGTVSLDGDGCFEISYDESEISGMEGSICRIVFNVSSPGLVSMIREGSVSTMLSFEEGKRHKCEYNTPYMPFQLAVNTLEVDNRLAESGELYLNYVMEIRGLGSERCTVELSINDIPRT